MTSTSSTVVQSALKAANELSDWIDEHHPRTFGFSRNGYVAASFFAMSLDHRAGVLLLAEAQAYGSAFALARSVFETYMRGVWMQHCASEADINTLLSHKRLPKFATVTKDLKTKAIHADDFFGTAAIDLWPLLCDYSHGGPRQLASWTTDNGIGPAHSDSEVAFILWLVDFCGLSATQRVAQISEMPMDGFTSRFKKMMAEVSTRADDLPCAGSEQRAP
jgi:hypothetical protein